MRSPARQRRRIIADQTAEQRDEALSPAAQRKPTTLRGARVERAGKGYVRSNPLRAIWRRSRGRTVTDLHLACSERLLRAYNETADGISVPARVSLEHGTGAPSTGSVSSAVLRGVNAQIDQANEWMAARAALGAAWEPVMQIVLLGRDVCVWAALRGWDERVAMGYLIGALDQLVAFYETLMVAPQAGRAMRKSMLGILA